MKKLNKNFRGQKRTVETMQGACSYYGNCACSAVMDCACNWWDDKMQYDEFDRQGKYYFQSFQNSAY